MSHSLEELREDFVIATNDLEQVADPIAREEQMNRINAILDAALDVGGTALKGAHNAKEAEES